MDKNVIEMIMKLGDGAYSAFWLYVICNFLENALWAGTFLVIALQAVPRALNFIRYEYHH